MTEAGAMGLDLQALATAVGIGAAAFYGAILRGRHKPAESTLAPVTDVTTLEEQVLKRLGELETKLATEQTARQAVEVKLSTVETEVVQLRQDNTVLKNERDDARNKNAHLETRVNELERNVFDMRVQNKAYEFLFERLNVRLDEKVQNA